MPVMERTLTYANYIKIFDEAGLIAQLMSRFQPWQRVSPIMIRATLQQVNPEIEVYEDGPHFQTPHHDAVSHAINASIRRNPAYREDMREWVIRKDAKDFKAGRSQLLRQHIALN